MEHSTMTETPESIQSCFMAGIVAAELNLGRDAVLSAVEKFRKSYPLGVMSMYDGYIRRKHGLVDEDGEEIFR